MPDVKIRYFVEKQGRSGPRYYWQPGKSLRQQGWASRRLSSDRIQAMAEAERLNREIDHGTLAPVSPQIAPPTERGAGVYVVGALGRSVKIGSSTPARKEQSWTS